MTKDDRFLSELITVRNAYTEQGRNPITKGLPIHLEAQLRSLQGDPVAEHLHVRHGAYFLVSETNMGPITWTLKSTGEELRVMKFQSPTVSKSGKGGTKTHCLVVTDTPSGVDMLLYTRAKAGHQQYVCYLWDHAHYQTHRSVCGMERVEKATVGGNPSGGAGHKRQGRLSTGRVSEALDFHSPGREVAYDATVSDDHESYRADAVGLDDMSEGEEGDHTVNDHNILQRFIRTSEAPNGNVGKDDGINGADTIGAVSPRLDDTDGNDSPPASERAEEAQTGAMAIDLTNDSEEEDSKDEMSVAICKSRTSLLFVDHRGEGIGPVVSLEDIDDMQDLFAHARGKYHGISRKPRMTLNLKLNGECIMYVVEKDKYFGEMLKVIMNKGRVDIKSEGILGAQDRCIVEVELCE